jgi:hypothetical protein
MRKQIGPQVCAWGWHVCICPYGVCLPDVFVELRVDAAQIIKSDIQDTVHIRYRGSTLSRQKFAKCHGSLAEPRPSRV